MSALYLNMSALRRFIVTAAAAPRMNANSFCLANTVAPMRVMPVRTIGSAAFERGFALFIAAVRSVAQLLRDLAWFGPPIPSAFWAE